MYTLLNFLSTLTFYDINRLLFDTSAPKKVVMTSQSHTAVFEIQTTRYEEFPQEILANVKLNDDQSGNIFFYN